MNISLTRRKELGRYLRQKRISAGLTQRGVANAVRLSSAQSISNIERGVAPVPTNILRQMVRLYGISEPELMWKLMDLQLRQWREDFFPESVAPRKASRGLKH